MNRRTFVRALVIGAAGLAVPEPIRTYFLPPVGGWKPQVITPAMMRAITAPFTLNDPLSGLSMRIIQEFDAHEIPQRMDVLYGTGNLRPDYLELVKTYKQAAAEHYRQDFAFHQGDQWPSSLREERASARDVQRDYEIWTRRQAILKEIDG